MRNWVWILPALLPTLVACGSDEFTAKPASNEDASAGGSGGITGNGGSGGFPQPDASIIDCDLDAAALNTEGCLCGLVGEVKGCYLGKPGPKSACATPGNQECETTPKGNVWSACVGASAPSDEQCFNDVDDDCDGDVDEDCPCTETHDLCKDENGTVFSPGDHLFFEPPSPKLGDTLRVYLVSTLPVNNTNLEVSSGSHCAGGAGAESCAAGAGCDGWTGARHFITITEPPFQAGQTADIKIYINGATDPPNGPCDSNAERKVTIQVPIQ